MTEQNYRKQFSKNCLNMLSSWQFHSKVIINVLHKTYVHNQVKLMNDKIMAHFKTCILINGQRECGYTFSVAHEVFNQFSIHKQLSIYQHCDLTETAQD